MDQQLLEYRQKSPALYLDGRFFNLVLGKHEFVVTKPAIINITPQAIWTNLNQIYINPTQDYVVIRVIIQLADEKGIVYSRHSNLLIINNLNKIIDRFEPLMGNVYDNSINEIIMEDLRYVLPGYHFEELDFHPQPVQNIGLCVAYVLKYAYYFLLGQPMIFLDEIDILKFANYVQLLYSDQLTGSPDIEFGNGFSSVAGGALVGGLAGGLIGGAIGGPSGAVGGLALGALGGAAAGGLAASRRR